jgi:hypothetical protein
MEGRVLLSLGTGAPTYTSLQVLTPIPPNPVWGQTVEFKATVSTSQSSFVPVPGGTLQFYDNSTEIGSGSVTNGVLTLSTSSLSVTTLTNTHSIEAKYLQDQMSGIDGATYDASNSTATPITINPASTTTSVTSSSTNDTSLLDQKVTFTATVSIVSPGAGTLGGTVYFVDGTTVLGSATLTGGSGTKVTYSTDTLAAGSHSITAYYADSTGDFNNSPASTAIAQSVSLNGQVFNDVNADGSEDDGETGASTSTTVELLSATNTVLAQTTTNMNGNFSFNSNLAAGAYTVEITPPANYIATTPTSISLSETASSPSALLFGIHYAPPITPANGAVLATGGWGFTDRGPWTSTPGGYSNPYLTTTSNITTNYAQWRIAVPAGKYDVWVTWVAASNDATTASYQVSDGALSLGSVTENQRLNPLNGSYGGVYWVDLGSFTFNSGLAYVRLSANANGPVSADGVLLVQNSVGPAIVGSSETGSMAVSTGGLGLTNFSIGSGVLPSSNTQSKGTQTGTTEDAVALSTPRVLVNQAPPTTQSGSPLLESRPLSLVTNQEIGQDSTDEVIGFLAAEIISAGNRNKVFA